MFCSKCGKNNADGVRFCSGCGEPFGVQPAQQQPRQQPVYQQPMYQQPVVPGKGLGIASMILGIISLVFFCYWVIAIPCGIIGVSLGAVSLNKAKAVCAKNGLAVAGITCSCIALGIALIFVILVSAGIAEAVAFLESL